MISLTPILLTQAILFGLGLTAIVLAFMVPFASMAESLLRPESGKSPYRVNESHFRQGRFNRMMKQLPFFGRR